MRIRRLSPAGGALFALGLALVLLASSPAGAASSAIVGTASTFGVLGGSAVTNTGPTVITGDVGVSPGTAITGFPPGIAGGVLHAADAVAGQAQSDATAGYDDLAGRASTAAVSGDLGGLTLTPGVYTSADSLLLTGTLTLDAEGNPDALFIFQVGSTLTTATDSAVALIGGARACNVYWQIGSSATLGTDSDFVGTLVALTSITATTGATIEGQLLARNGAVTLDTNTIDSSACAASAPGGGTTSTTVATTPGGTTAGDGTATAAPASSSTTAVPGGSTTATPTATPAPRLPETGVDTARAAALAVLLVLVGAWLVWIGQPPLLHARRRSAPWSPQRPTS